MICTISSILLWGKRNSYYDWFRNSCFVYLLTRFSASLKSGYTIGTATTVKIADPNVPVILLMA